MDKPDGANRTGPGHPGFALQIAVSVLFAPAKSTETGPGAEQEAIAKVEKARSDNDKNQDLNI
jgi:hypothetical protein